MRDAAQPDVRESSRRSRGRGRGRSLSRSRSRSRSRKGRCSEQGSALYDMFPRRMHTATLRHVVLDDTRAPRILRVLGHSR